MTNPTVSVVMITYGHENYINDALAGALMQEYNGFIELIIANDNSPDQSDKVINDFFIKNPVPKNFIIRYTKHATNKGAIPNFVWALQQTTGKYIAICEGDDYWTDPFKLQKQVDFLEKNQDFSIVFHKVKELTDLGFQETTILKGSDQEETYTVNDLIKGNFMHTPSVLFKKVYNTLPAWMEYSPIGDYPLHMLNSEHGPIKYFPEEMAVYRVGQGIWSSKGRVYQIVNTLFTLTFLISHFADNLEIKDKLKEQYNSLITKLTENQNHLNNAYIEKSTYNLSYKKLITILLKKIKYSIIK